MANAGHRGARPVEDPGEQDERGDDCVAERHGDERDPETGLRRDRREIAVEQIARTASWSASAARITNARDSDVQRRDPACRGDAVEPVRQPRRQRLAEDEQPESRSFRRAARAPTKYAHRAASSVQVGPVEP